MEPPTRAHSIYVAGPIYIDPVHRKIIHASGCLIPVSPQGLDVLLELLRAWPRPVPPREIANRVLRADVADAKTQVQIQIYRLRGLLPRDEHGRPPIVLIRHYGYTLNVPVWECCDGTNRCGGPQGVA